MEQFTPEDIHFIKRLQVSEIMEQTLTGDVLGRRWNLSGLKTLINKTSAISLTLLIFAVVRAVCGWLTVIHIAVTALLLASLLHCC